MLVAGSLIPPDWRLRLRRDWWLLAIAVLVLILLLLATQLPAWLSSSSSNTGTQTIWDAITAGIDGDKVPKSVALEAFAYDYKVDIPGVTIPAGIEGGDAPTSGTVVWSWVMANWDALTPDQQAIITRLTTPQPGDLTVPIDSAHATAPAGVKLAVARGSSSRTDVFDLPSTSLQQAMESDVATDIQHVATVLGTTPIGPNLPLATNVELTFMDESGGDALFITKPVELGSGHFEPCSIEAYKEAWSSESPTSGGGVSPRLHELLTHEVIHCYQNVVWGSNATAVAIPTWISEGTAFYLAQLDTGTAEVILPNAWRKWFKPELPLTNRSYDAFGYFVLLNHEGRDLWGLMEQAWQAASKGPERSNAFIAVLTGDADDVRDAWAPGYVRDADWGDPWLTTGFGLPDDVEAIQHPAQAQPAPGYTGSLLSRSNTLLNVTDSDGEVVTVATTGLASVHDDTDGVALAFQSRRFCVHGDCVCPPNTVRAGEQMADQPMILPLVVALNAPEGGSTYSVISDKMEDLCGRQATPQPSPSGPCPGPCPGSNGDPHLATVNHYKYDFQAAGEFTLLRSSDDSLEIQARQEPYSPFTAISTNTAIAARDAGHRIAVYVANGQLAVKLDGNALDPTITTTFGGGRIAPYNKGFEIDFPDGTRLWTLSVGIWGINAVISPSSGLASTGVGLLGTLVPGGMGVPALPDGTRLPIASGVDQRNSVLYGQFADAWRVTNSTTLFDYDPGKSTATYTIPNYPLPAHIVAPEELTAAQLASGRAACGGVTDQDLNEDCVYDVAVSGAAGFADGYAAVAYLYDSGVIGQGSQGAPGSSQGTSQGSAPPPSGGPLTAVRVADVLDIMGAAVGPDDTLYVSVDTPANTAAILAIDPRTGSVTHQITVPTATDLHFVDGALFAPGVAPDASGGKCTVSRFDPVTLASQATLAVPCTFGYAGPKVVSSGSALWYEDTSHFDGSTGKGANMVRIDPASGAPGASVSLPDNDGCCQNGQGAIYCYCGGGNEWQLADDGSAFQSVGNYNPIYPAGNGFWTEQGGSAVYVTGPGGPTTTIPLQGNDLVGGDATGFYYEQSRQTFELFRQPADGSPPTQIATAPTFGSGLSQTSPDYLIGGFPSFATADGFAHYWIEDKVLYLQWAPLH